jgi:acyl-CoA thioester hydrolase
VRPARGAPGRLMAARGRGGEPQASAAAASAGTSSFAADAPGRGAARVSIEERVRWSDVDAAGIICYGAYLRFYEIAETELFRAAGEPYHEVFDRYDVWLPRVHIESDFAHPAFLDDLLRVTAKVERVGRSSIHLGFRVSRESREIARARFVMACVSRRDLKSRPLPARLAERLGGRAPAAEAPLPPPAGERPRPPARADGPE